MQSQATSSNRLQRSFRGILKQIKAGKPQPSMQQEPDPYKQPTDQQLAHRNRCSVAKKSEECYARAVACAYTASNDITCSPEQSEIATKGGTKQH